MPSPAPLDDELDAAIERAFAPDDRERVRHALLAARCSARTFIVLLAAGDAGQVEDLVKWDQLDWREVQARFQGKFHRQDEPELVARCRQLGLPVPYPWSKRLPEKVEADVKQFIAERFVRRTEQIHGALELQADLGLTSCPAGPDFIEAFAKRFGVDLKSFRPDRHFRAREWDGLGAEFLRFLLRRPRPPLAPITVADLVAAAQSKRLA